MLLWLVKDKLGSSVFDASLKIHVHGSHLGLLLLLHLLPIVIVEHNINNPEVGVCLPCWPIGSQLVWLGWECAVSDLVGLGSSIPPRCGTEAPVATIGLVLDRSTTLSWV